MTSDDHLKQIISAKIRWRIFRELSNCDLYWTPKNKSDIYLDVCSVAIAINSWTIRQFIHFKNVIKGSSTI